MAMSSFSPWFIRPQKTTHCPTTSFRSIIVCSSSASKSHGFRGRPAEEVSVMVAGSTGYIGKFVVRELVSRGYKVLAVARKESNKEGLGGAELCYADVTSSDSLHSALSGRQVDVVVSCLASRGGGVKDSWDIDYQATKDAFEAGITAGASHMVLLSAICVQKPLLEFQKAKLQLEGEMQKSDWASGASWSIVRPTAFFKSLGGQVEIVKGGGPFVVFGDGKLCACKPISERDLAAFIADSIEQDEKMNQVLPIGGPGPAYTPLEQGELLFRILDKAPKFIKVPIQVMDFAISALDTLAGLFPSLQDPAEYAKIGRYYAAESMLVLDPVTGKYVAEATPGYGTDTLEQFFRKVVAEGMAGQELGQQAAFIKQ